MNKKLKVSVLSRYIYIYIFFFEKTVEIKIQQTPQVLRTLETSAYMIEKVSHFSQPSPNDKMEFVVCEKREIIFKKFPNVNIFIIFFIKKKIIKPQN